MISLIDIPTIFSPPTQPQDGKLFRKGCFFNLLRIHRLQVNVDEDLRVLDQDNDLSFHQGGPSRSRLKLWFLSLFCRKINLRNKSILSWNVNCSIFGRVEKSDVSSYKLAVEQKHSEKLGLCSLSILCFHQEYFFCAMFIICRAHSGNERETKAYCMNY